MDRTHHPHHALGHRSLRLSSLVTALACAGLAAGCGGGDDALTVTGTAATGAALAGAAVDVKCATGSASATTGADGSYSASISGGALPCVARVTPAAANGTVLHGVSTASGSSARINLTPLTQLIVARLAQAEPAGYYAGFDGGAAAALTASAVAGAQAAVVAKLKAGGVDFGAVADASGGPLAARNGSTAGDGHDQLLDQLQAALAAGGSSLTALAAATAAEAAVMAGKASSSGTASPPGELLLKPAASNCRGLRSGTYSVIGPWRGASLAEQAGEFVLDAQALTASFSATDQTTLTPNGNCAYTADGGSTQVMVAASGLMVWRYLDEGSYHVAVAVPKQAHALAELAGDWNHLNLNAAGSAYTGAAGTLSIAADGAITGKLDCQNDATWSIKTADCTVPSGSNANDGVLRANAAGGFDGADSSTGAANARVFAFRAGNGDLMLMHVGADGSFGFHTRVRSNTPPTVGGGSTSWNVTIARSGLAPNAVSASSNTTLSVDTAAGSYLRQAGTVGQNTMHPETVMINSPRDGYNNRLAATVTNSAGASENVSEWTLLTLRGIGMTPLILPAGRTLVLSVTQP
ncbi:MAG: hypothetical protein QM750_13675 [Rubrivivax sp.]